MKSRRFSILLSSLLIGILALGSFGQFSFAEISLNFKRFYHSVYSNYGEQRSRLANTWNKELAQIKGMPEQQKLIAVNNFINRVIFYQSDISNYRLKDYWATLGQSFGHGAGDCEDYAIAKYVTLRLAGVPDERLRLIYVRATTAGRNEAHMVLGYYATPNSMPLILDNLIGEVKSAQQRRDLTPVFSFNSKGLWAGLSKKTKSDPMARLSRWQQVMTRLKNEGISLR